MENSEGSQFNTGAPSGINGVSGNPEVGPEIDAGNGALQPSTPLIKGNTATEDSDINVVKVVKRRGRKPMLSKPAGVRRSDRGTSDSGGQGIGGGTKLQLPGNLERSPRNSSASVSEVEVNTPAKTNEQPFPPLTLSGQARKRRPRLETSLRICRDLLTEIFSKKHKDWAWPLFKPDRDTPPFPNGSGIFLIDIKNKMADRKYSNFEEFRADIYNLVDAFCKRFPSNHGTHNSALKLRRLFDDEFKKFVKPAPHLNGCEPSQDSPRVNDIFTPFQDLRGVYPDFSTALNYNQLFGPVFYNPSFGMMNRDTTFPSHGQNYNTQSNRFGGGSPQDSRDSLTTPPPPVPEITMNSTGSEDHLADAVHNINLGMSAVPRDLWNETDNSHNLANSNVPEGQKDGEQGENQPSGSGKRLRTLKEDMRTLDDDATLKRVKLEKEAHTSEGDSQRLRMNGGFGFATIKNEPLSDDDENPDFEDIRNYCQEPGASAPRPAHVDPMRILYCEWIMNALKVNDPSVTERVFRGIRSVAGVVENFPVGIELLTRMDTGALQNIVFGIMGRTNPNPLQVSSHGKPERCSDCQRTKRKYMDLTSTLHDQVVRIRDSSTSTVSQLYRLCEGIMGTFAGIDDRQQPQ